MDFTEFCNNTTEKLTKANNKKNEVIFGLQTDKPLKRIVNLYGGIRTAKTALGAYNKKRIFRLKNGLFFCYHLIFIFSQKMSKKFHFFKNLIKINMYPKYCLCKFISI